LFHFPDDDLFRSDPGRDELLALADQLIPPSWRGRMVFSGGVSDSAIKDALQSASYYLSASLSDGASSSLLEAMACGLFPIISDIPANREWITHEKNGLLFPAGDDSALSACIRRAIVGEPWMAQARISNRRLVEERANIDVSMRALVGLLTSTRADRKKA
jgi:glycosyltransferase involved in cell wall biosynthesis